MNAIAADFSFTKPTGAQLASIGVTYAGGYFSQDPTKNLTRAELSDLLAHGLAVTAFYEDSAQWMLGGAPAGKAAGQRVDAQATQIGYDLSKLVLASADFDVTTNSQEGEILACLEAFKVYVPVVGFYGDTDGIGRVKGVSACNWETDAMSWSNGKTSPLADLQQRYNDPRARGLAIDISDVIHPPKCFMGEKVSPLPVPAGPPKIVSPAGLKVGQALVSPNRTHFFQVQADGNCVVYNTLTREPLWSTRTSGKGTTVFSVQPDGNLVAYDAHTAVWTSSTDKAGPIFLQMQNDGNLVAYTQSGNHPVWSSRTAGK